MLDVSAVALLLATPWNWLLFQLNWHEFKSWCSQVWAMEEAIAFQHHADGSLTASSGEMALCEWPLRDEPRSLVWIRDLSFHFRLGRGFDWPNSVGVHSLHLLTKSLNAFRIFFSILLPWFILATDVVLQNNKGSVRKNVISPRTYPSVCRVL